MLYFYPEDFGAVADGKVNDVKAIQNAIDKAEENGGGTVVLTSGKTYFSKKLFQVISISITDYHIFTIHFATLVD